MRVLRTHGRSASKVMPGFFHHRDPAGTCGCHGDDFMTEGSDALLDRLDRVMKDEFNAKMLGRVGRGQLTEVKFLKWTLRWHEQEMCFSWSGGTRYVTELAVLLGLTDTRAVTKTRTPGTKGGDSNGSVRRRKCLRNTWTQTGQARKREGAQPEHSNSLDSIPSNSAA